MTEYVNTSGTAEPVRRGKAWAYGAAVTGGTVSVLANVTHSYVPAQVVGMADEAWRALPNARPQPGAVLLAAFWPCALLLALEVLARVDWPRQLRWTLVRWFGVTPVAVVAAVVSYRHLSGLLHWYGEDGLTVAIGPAAVDGLMVVSTGALLALAGRAAVPVGSGVVTHPDVDPSVHPSNPVDRMADRMDGSEPIGSDGSDAGQPTGSGEPDGSDRVVPLHSVADQVEETPMTSARPDDLGRARAAIQAGELDRTPTADAVRDSLKIGLGNARAVRDALRGEAAQAERGTARTTRRGHQ